MELADPETDVEADYKRFRRWQRGRQTTYLLESDVFNWCYAPDLDLLAPERKGRSVEICRVEAKQRIMIWLKAGFIVPYSRVSYRFVK